jgi:sec-independent protein translocase protein TatC
VTTNAPDNSACDAAATDTGGVIDNDNVSAADTVGVTNRANGAAVNDDGDSDTAGSGMPLAAHIEELRWALVRCGCAVIACAVPCGVFWRRVFELFAVYPLRLSDPAPRIIYTAPAETVMLSFKIAMTGGVTLASPFIFWQIWSFISPGLYKKEKSIIFPAALASTFCFLAGIAFCYLTLPLLLKFLTGFAAGQLDPFFKIDEYFDFLIKMSLAFGLAFELPVVAFVLSRTGVIDHSFLIKYFRYAIVAIFVVAAILTPPDVLSQTLLALPLVALYALSILIAFLARRKI